MSFTHWLSNHLGLSRRQAPVARPTFRPALETLEDRWVPSTLTVRNNLDSGADSLRAEIAAAKNGDTIVFVPSLDGQTITLTSGELLIKKSMTITGPGAGNLTVSGNHTSRVFELGKGASSVTLSGLTVSNGSHILGGGIYLQGGSTLTLNGCTLCGNSAVVVRGYGGAIFSGGTLTVNSCTLSGNSATYGGAIYVASSTATVSGSTLSGNSATYGGGIYSDIGSLTVSSSTLTANVATSEAGGIFSGGTLRVKNSSSITGNTASAGSGADVYNNGVLYLDSTSTIGILDGNPAVGI
jgi:predicted outer membrane repeat protein